MQSIVFIGQIAYAQQLPLPPKINVICTNNLDGTGECYEVKTNTLLKCTGVPGEIIPCRIPGGPAYNCIFFSEALLECSQLVSKISQEEVSSDDRQSAFDSDLDDSINGPSFNNRPDRLVFDSKSGESQDLNTKNKLNDSINQMRLMLLPTW